MNDPGTMTNYKDSDEVQAAHPSLQQVECEISAENL
jgi:hypothetical protein